MIIPFLVADRIVGLDPIASWLRVQIHPIALIWLALRPGGMLNCRQICLRLQTHNAMINLIARLAFETPLLPYM
jgi:hypothetical protein